MSRPNSVLPSRLRYGGLLGVLIAGTLVFAAVAQRHTELGGWLFFHYARAVCFAAVFGLACLAAGHALLLRVLGRSLPLEEHVAVAAALGVLAFFLVSFALGLAGLYGPTCFWACPGLLLLFGGRAGLGSLERFKRHARELRWRLAPWQILLLGFGCAGVALVWFPILTPQNASYDARWYHLSIAQHYIAEGRIRAFSEGWVPGAMPQLASLLYAWALSGPGSLFDRVETAAHVELVVFLFTLVGVSALVRRVLGERAPWAFAALFLFPGIFCYDSGLVLGADHVAALWAAPVLLLSLRYLDEPSRPLALLLGAVVAGALDTKYTAISLVPLPAAVVLTRTIRDLRTLRARSLFGPLQVALSVLVFTTPHWLKNWAFYGDPLFPVLRAWLPAHPWSAPTEAPYTAWFKLRHPRFGWAGLGEMLETLVTFSFVPHDFPEYHRDVPIFGSLFTLLTPALLFLRRQQRLLWLFGGVYLGLVAWFWLHAFDRYLQALLPWMAAGTAVVLSRLWREGPLVRAACSGLVGLQLVWAGDVPFIPAHRAAGAAVQKVVIDLLGRRYQDAKPLEAYPDWEAMGRALPAGAKVLIHEEEIHFGLSRATALDYSGDQGAFYWGEPGAATPRQMWSQLRSHGITHLLWAKNLDHGTDSVAAGLTFFDFALHHTRPVGTFGGFSLAELTSDAPADAPASAVAYYPCDKTPPFSPGLYPLEALTRTPGDRRSLTQPRTDLSLERAIATSQFLVFDVRCHGHLPDTVRNEFELLAARGNAMLLERRPGR